uniref:Pappalysin 2 n=1 Tax=Salmo trutta TaxID=8032 RepID=A0A674C6N0_SALTR
MLFVRLLAVVLIMINTWLLNSAQSDHIQRYKRAMAQRADSELAHLASEQCRSTRQPRQAAYSALVPHLPPVAHPRRYTTRQSGLYHITHLEESSCSGGCNSDANSNPGLDSASHWGKGEKKVSRGNSEAMIPKDKEERHVKIIGMVSSPHPNFSRKPPSRADVTVDSSSDNDKPEVDGGRSEGPHKQLLLKKQQRVLTGRVRRTLTVSHGEDSWAAFPESIVKSRGIFSTFRQHSDYSAEIEDYPGEQEGPPSRASTLWGAQIPDVPPKWMSALYFSGQKEQLRVNPAAGIELPRAKFSVELWANPEGGQTNPAIIAGVFDNCSHSLSEKGWSIGIRTVKPGGRKDARFFFTLRTDRAPKATTIYGHQRYHPNSWTHLMASYNGHKMKLYIDGAKVGESSLQSGNLYSPFMETCRTLLLGGDQSDLGHNFRGYIGGIVLWVLPRTHEDLLKGPSRIDKREPNLALWADFSKVEQQWSPHKEGYHPSIVIIPIPEQEHVSPFLPPPCGLTTCDNTDIILGYNNHWQLRTEKRIRYRIVNICNDDGSHPTVSQAQIQMQHQALVEAFRSYNISLELSTHTVQNTSVRQRFILSNCRISKIGNRHCDAECDHPLTGHDGGDCLRLGPCYNWKRRDGVCNTECNSIHYDYDDGDCCDPEVTDVLKTCFDPESPDRAYMSVKELKELLHLSSTDNLNVYFANNSAREELAGAATWPWAKEALNHQGGMVMNPSYFGTIGHNNTMIHEMGHIFGLYHVFKGVSERESCDDPCRETTPSMETGDLCADTAPTPKSKACHDPGHVSDTCGITLYQDTPYNNYMSYTDDNCTNHFTPNQVARMHCYMDLVYENWLNNRRPSPIPLKPMVIRQSSDSVSIHWLPPVRGVNCRYCEADGVFHQYAYEATSPRVCDSSGYWTPEEAIGPPDVYQPCEPSLQAWSPELSLYDANVTSPCPETEGCVLMLSFLHPVVPDSLTVWVTYVSAGGSQAIANIELITDTDESFDMGPQHVFCDVPLTLRVHTEKRVAAVKLSTFDEKMEIDAILFTSGPHNPLCSSCQPLIYRVVRQPAFSGDLVQQTLLTFTDSDIVKDKEYQYRVQVEADGLLSELSPPLLYIHGAAYCGDGLLQGTEDCDDGNLLDGDGCSKKCHMESGFNCNDEPSLCYVFEGDGVCEVFERGSSVQDCGYFTPHGYSDQWASTAAASYQDQSSCPVLGATGEPSLSKVMNEKPSLDIWFPCTAQSYTQTHYGEEDTVWLKVGFAQPGVATSVIIYLASDGAWPGEQCRKTVFIQLCDTGGRNHSLGSFELSCQQNPLVVNVTHNLSQPFFLTTAVILNFSSPFVAVTGVALRTSCHFSAFALTRCAEGGRETELQCVHGAWDRVVSCQPIDCGPPDQSHVYFAVFSCPWGTTFGKQCSFTCNPPAILQGDSDRLVCLDDGLWSFPEAYCKIECSEPPTVPNAKLLVPQCEGTGHDVGTVCRYKCNPGCYVTGSLKTKFLKVECVEGGQWEEGGCEPIPCPSLPAVYEGMFTCTNGRHYNSLCTLQCPHASENHTIRCTKDGEWTEKFTMCTRLNEACPPPPDVSWVQYACDEGFSVGAVCYPTCSAALHDPVVLANSTTADSVKHWMLPGRVQDIVCTGMTRWHPDPKLIHCIQSCEPFGGDGWCDTINNRAYCEYDGGDCCPSTLSTRKVIQFGADCDQDECTCRDPNAEENKSKAKYLEAGLL